MKALTVRQPWAELIVAGRKAYETRDWATSYRGLLAVHAGARMTREEREIAREFGLDPDTLTLGAVVGTAVILSCRRTDDVVLQLPASVVVDELRAGDWTGGRYAWHLGRVTRLETPVPVRGALGLWSWEP